MSPMLLLAQVKIELRSSTFRFHGSEGLVARGPGDSDADLELQRREESHSKVRENLNTSSEEEEERGRAAASAAAPEELGSAGPADPVVIVEEEEEGERKEEEREKSPETEEKSPETDKPEKKRPKVALKPKPTAKTRVVKSKAQPKAANRSDFIQVEAGRAVLRGTPRLTYEVRGLRGRSEVRRGEGPTPAERVELAPRPPTAERGPSENAPWRRSSAKPSRPKGFRLRSSQSRQYRNLRGLLRLARKKGEGVPQDLKDQIEDFGSGRTETYKVGRVRKRKAAKSPSGEPCSSRTLVRVKWNNKFRNSQQPSNNSDNPSLI